jgi:hypothetical protein
MDERVCSGKLGWEDIYGRNGGFHGRRRDWRGGSGIGCAEGGGWRGSHGEGSNGRRSALVKYSKESARTMLRTSAG